MGSNVGETINVRNVNVSTTTKAKIRAGIVGAGLMGRWHARAVKRVGGEVVSVADVDEKRAAGLAGCFSSAQGFGNVEDMLSQMSLDVVHVCTPLSSHRTIAELTIKAGVSLIVEKPLAETAEETIRLFNLAADHDVFLCPVHQFAFQPGVTRAKKMISKIGNILHMRATICSAGGEGFDDEQLDLIASDILPHPLSLFQVFLNNILPGENWNLCRPRPGEFRIDGYAQETSMSIFVSMSARPTSNSFQIIGTNGTIYLDLFHGFAVLESGKVSKTRKILQPFDIARRNFSAATLNLMRRTFQFEAAYPGLRQLIGNFYQSLREGGEPAITPAKTINVAQVRDFLICRARIDRRPTHNSKVESNDG